MIRRQHVVRDFFAEAEQLRHALDERFNSPYIDSIDWHYFSDPRMYTYLRTSPKDVFPEEVFARFNQRLRLWCLENLGLVPSHAPSLHLMVNGCRLGHHSDYHNGVWGYVFSLTRWESRKFSGGETLIFRDEPLSYRKHHVHGEDLYELIPARFNQLLIFDDRIVHGTPTIEGSMDPLDGRIALVGHIRATSPVVSGGLKSTEAREVIQGFLAQLHDRIKSYRDVQGTMTWQLTIGCSGSVDSLTVLTDNLVSQLTGYGPADSVAAVKLLIRQAASRLKFPAAAASSTVIVPVLVPLPQLSPIEFSIPHDSSPQALCEWQAKYPASFGEFESTGHWQGHAYHLEEPVAGVIRIESRHISFRFDAPMWVASQRERFEAILREWGRAAVAAKSQHVLRAG